MNQLWRPYEVIGLTSLFLLMSSEKRALALAKELTMPFYTNIRLEIRVVRQSFSSALKVAGFRVSDRSAMDYSALQAHKTL